MSSTRLPLVLLTLLISIVACGESPEQKAARKELEQLGIEFNRKQFLDRIAESDLVAVDMFLSAGISGRGKKKATEVAVENGHRNIVGALLDDGVKPGGTLLCTAARRGDIDIVRLLLDAGANPNESWNPFYRCIPVYATRAPKIMKLLLDNGATLPPSMVPRGDLGMAALLLDNGADVDARDGDGRTALLSAAWDGNVELVWFLLDKGADARAMDNRKSTALDLTMGGSASARQRTEIVSLLLDGGADPDEGMGWGQGPLHLAARGYEDATRILLDKGADVNALDRFGWTPLIFAAESGIISTATELLNRGADIYATSKEGETALIRAKARGNSDIERLLRGSPEVWRKAWEELESQRDGKTILTLRSESEIAQSAREKLKRQQIIVPKEIAGPVIKGDSPDARTARKELAEQNISFDRKTFIDLPKQAGTATMKLFLAAGMNPDSGVTIDHFGDHSGETALMVATKHGRTEMVKSLLEAGANPDIYNDIDGTAVVYAAEHGHTEGVRLLLERELTIDAKDSDGMTALMFATLRGDIEMVKLILEMEPDVNLREEGRWGSCSLALEMATRGGHTDIVKLLLE